MASKSEKGEKAERGSVTVIDDLTAQEVRVQFEGRTFSTWSYTKDGKHARAWRLASAYASGLDHGLWNMAADDD